MRSSLNRGQIKYIAMLTMLLNHIANLFLEAGTLLFELFIDVGYFTMPVMCYFLVEGFYYTHSRRRYGIRLCLFAALSQIPYHFAFTGKLEGLGIGEVYGLNVLVTLLLCFGILLILETSSSMAERYAAIGAVFLLSLFCDWAVTAPLMTLLFVWAGSDRGKKKTAFGLAAVAVGLQNFLPYVGVLPLARISLYALGSMLGPALAGIAVICCYNGCRMERGRTFSKWFFYVFYPLHLLVLGGIKYWM